MKLRNIYLGLIALIVLAACESGYDPDVSVSDSIPTQDARLVLSERGFSILVQAIDHAGITFPADSVTLFAPTNEAFAAFLSNAGVNTITELPSEAVADVLSYHIVPGVVTAANVSNSSFTTLSGGTIRTSQNAAINGTAAVVNADLLTTDGIVHGINKVLSAPTGTVLEVIQGRADLSILAGGVAAAGLGGAVNGSDLTTVFAPTNDAMNAAGITAAGDLTAEQWADVITYHVLGGVNFAQDMFGESVSPIKGTLADTIPTIQVSSTPSANGSVITERNVLATNGVVHVVSSVVSEPDILLDLFDQGTDNTGFDGFGFDAFGSIALGLEYSRFGDLSDTLTVYTQLFGPTYGAFADDAAATAYLEDRTFEGNVNFSNLDNGSKVEAVSGAEYYIGVDAADSRAYVNGTASNAFGGAATSFSYFDGTALLYSGNFNPLPSDDLLTVMAGDADISLLVAFVEAAVATGQLTLPEDVTIFAPVDAAFSAATGFTTTADIDTLAAGQDDDIALITELLPIILDHVVGNVEFSSVIATDFPVLTTLGENELEFLISPADDAIVIEIRDGADQLEYRLQAVDILSSTGIYHKIDGVLVF